MERRDSRLSCLFLLSQRSCGTALTPPKPLRPPRERWGAQSPPEILSRRDPAPSLPRGCSCGRGALPGEHLRESFRERSPAAAVAPQPPSAPAAPGRCPGSHRTGKAPGASRGTNRLGNATPSVDSPHPIPAEPWGRPRPRQCRSQRFPDPRTAPHRALSTGAGSGTGPGGAGAAPALLNPGS